MRSAWSPLAGSRECGWVRTALSCSFDFSLYGSPADGSGLLGDGHVLFYVTVKLSHPKR